VHRFKKMKIRVTYPNPPTIENWDTPEAWASKDVEIDREKIMWIDVYEWSDKLGMRVYLINGTALEWHFVEHTIQFNRLA
jgi:hypothetical protein